MFSKNLELLAYLETFKYSLKSHVTEELLEFFVKYKFFLSGTSKILKNAPKFV